MNIDFVARRVRLDARVREIVEKKLAKLSKVLPKDAQAHVVVERVKKDVSLEVTVVGRQRTWTAKEINQDQQAAAHAVLDRIAAQAKKTKSKVREEKKHRSPGGVRAPEVWAAPAPAPRSDSGGLLGPREAVRARPMFEEDALHRFTSRDHDVLVFRDPGSDALRVLYRRRDGSLGLLMPS